MYRHIIMPIIRHYNLQWYDVYYFDENCMHITKFTKKYAMNAIWWQNSHSTNLKIDSVDGINFRNFQSHQTIANKNNFCTISVFLCIINQNKMPMIFSKKKLKNIMWAALYYVLHRLFSFARKKPLNAIIVLLLK